VDAEGLMKRMVKIILWYLLQKVHCTWDKSILQELADSVKK